MKLILAIVSSDDSATVQAALTKKHFPITKLATTGGFLKAGNTTFIVGVEDDKVEEVIFRDCRAQQPPNPDRAQRFCHGYGALRLLPRGGHGRWIDYFCNEC